MREVNAGAELFLSFFSFQSGIAAFEMVLPTFRVGLPSSFKSLWNVLSDTPKGLSH